MLHTCFHMLHISFLFTAPCHGSEGATLEYGPAWLPLFASLLWVGIMLSFHCLPCVERRFTLFTFKSIQKKKLPTLYITPRSRQTLHWTMFLSISSLCPSQLYCHFVSVKPLVRSKFSILKNMIRRQNKIGVIKNSCKIRRTYPISEIVPENPVRMITVT